MGGTSPRSGRRPRRDPLLRAFRARQPNPAEESGVTRQAGRNGRSGWDEVRARGPLGLLRLLGPGLITGASDDDPSGIGTYSQVGSQFGFGLLWTALFMFPLMASVQELCARIALQTG